MKNVRCLFYVLLCAWVLVACNTQKKALSEAQSLRATGQHQLAFDRYYGIYSAEPTSVEAYRGLKETGSYLVNMAYAQVQMLVGQERYDAALNALDEAERFYNQYVWLEFQRPFYAQTIRQEIHQAIADSNFALAKDAVQHERWDDARMYLNIARRYDRSKEEIEYLDLMIRILPDYKRGQKAMELKLYQEAYGFFEKVSHIDADFGDVLNLMDECLALGRITLAVVQLPQDSGTRVQDRALVSSVKQALLARNNPFIRLVSRDDLDFLLEEQRNSMMGTFDERALIEAGKLLGAEYIILGDLLKYDLKTTLTRNQAQKGYAGRNLLSKKVEYFEKESTLSLEALYRYTLVRAETGEVLAAENISFYEEDVIHWAEYMGDHASLHPGNWNFIGLPSLQDKVHVDQKPMLDQLLKARNRHVPASDFENRFFDQVGSEVALRVSGFAQERRNGF
jgi:curli biogenesis system outer membrane secretion channel CsgG